MTVVPRGSAARLGRSVEDEPPRSRCGRFDVGAEQSSVPREAADLAALWESDPAYCQTSNHDWSEVPTSAFTALPSSSAWAAFRCRAAFGAVERQSCRCLRSGAGLRSGACGTLRWMSLS